MLLTTLGSRLSRRAVAVLIAVGVACGLGAVVQVDQAAASAYSCTGYGIGWKYGHPSQFCGQTVGSGTYVQTAGAGYSAPIAWAGWLTNTRVRVEFVDTRGSVYWSSTSGQQNGGSAVGAWKWTLNAWMRPGTVRYTLLSNGATIAVVQQGIH